MARRSLRPVAVAVQQAGTAGAQQRAVRSQPLDLLHAGLPFRRDEALPADWYYPVLTIGEETFKAHREEPSELHVLRRLHPAQYLCDREGDGGGQRHAQPGRDLQTEPAVSWPSSASSTRALRCARRTFSGSSNAFDEGKEPISPEVVQFFDDGRVDPRSQLRDRKADDGIYTGFVEIRADLNQPTEFRVSIQATTSPESRFIELDNPMATDPAATDANVLQPPTSLARLTADPAALEEDARRAQNRGGTQADEFLFQRATTVHFLVEP